MKRLFVGTAGAIALFASSSVSAAEVKLTKQEMINTITEVSNEALDLCEKTKIAYGDPYTMKMCKHYSDLTPLYIKLEKYFETSQEFYPHYMEFLEISQMMSEAFMLDMKSSESN